MLMKTYARGHEVTAALPARCTASSAQLARRHFCLTHGRDYVGFQGGLALEATREAERVPKAARKGNPPVAGRTPRTGSKAVTHRDREAVLDGNGGSSEDEGDVKDGTLQLLASLPAHFKASAGTRLGPGIIGRVSVGTAGNAVRGGGILVVRAGRCTWAAAELSSDGAAVLAVVCQADGRRAIGS